MLNPKLNKILISLSNSREAYAYYAHVYIVDKGKLLYTDGFIIISLGLPMDYRNYASDGIYSVKTGLPSDTKMPNFGGIIKSAQEKAAEVPRLSALAAAKVKFKLNKKAALGVTDEGILFTNRHRGEFGIKAEIFNLYADLGIKKVYRSKTGASKYGVYTGEGTYDGCDVAVYCATFGDVN